MRRVVVLVSVEDEELPSRVVDLMSPLVHLRTARHVHSSASLFSDSGSISPAGTTRRSSLRGIESCVVRVY